MNSQPRGAQLKPRTTLSDRLDQAMFGFIYDRSLVYNACWEDPAVDRQALQINGDDAMVVITSAGCNVLDYALDAPRRIHAVDANPRQTALLELKLAGIRRLQFADFFRLFGTAGHPEYGDIYHSVLRQELSPFAQSWWDRHLNWFPAHAYARHGFYYRGLSGLVARAFRRYLDLRPALRDSVERLFEAGSVDQQRELYDSRIRPHFWNGGLNWVLGRQATMSLLGVPHPQRKEVEAQHAGGVAGFVRESLEYVLRELPLSSNYFYAVYVRGGYTPGCSPAYLQPENFQRLKAGLVDHITPHTATVTQFLRTHPGPFSKFVLLDHMDWMAGYHPDALAEEWELILRRAAPATRVIFRSAHARPRYLDQIHVAGTGDTSGRLLDRLRFHPEWARALTLQDRVHTYAGFHIADVMP